MSVCNKSDVTNNYCRVKRYSKALYKCKMVASYGRTGGSVFCPIMTLILLAAHGTKYSGY